MKFSRIKKAYFIFSRKERNASLLLILLIAASIVFPTIENKTGHHVTAGYGEMKNLFKVEEQQSAAEQTVHHEYPERQYDKTADQKINTERELFSFDPNKITAEEWMKLGVPVYIAERIVNYRNKGGYFKQQEDLLKIYGFRQEDYDILKDYIVINPVEKNDINKKEEAVQLPVEMVVTDINVATKDEIMALGFSASLADRIIKFREGLGGIYSMEQLNAVFGMDATVLDHARPFIVIDAGSIRQLSLNTATVEELAKHVYISDELAAEIISYRESSGRFISVSEVMKVKGMYKSLFEKLKPYLTL